MDKKVIEFDDKGKEKLSVNFAMFRMKLPEQITQFKAEFTRIIGKIKDLIDYESPELKEELRLFEEQQKLEE